MNFGGQNRELVLVEGKRKSTVEEERKKQIRITQKLTRLPYLLVLLSLSTSLVK